MPSAFSAPTHISRIVGPPHECSPIPFKPQMPFKTIFFYPSLIYSLYHPERLHSQQMSSHLLQGTETMKERTPQLPALPIWQHNLHLLSTYFSLHHPTKDTYPFSPNSILQPLYSVMALPTSSETLFYQLFLFPLPSPLF